MIDVLETLTLAASLGVKLGLDDFDRIVAEPKGKITPELREAIQANIEEIKQHLRSEQASWQYQLLADIAVAGITLRIKKDGLLYASPSQAVLANGLRDRITENKIFLVDLLEMDEEKKIASEAEVRTLVRSQFDTELHEPVPTTKEAWVDEGKKQFFLEGRET